MPSILILIILAVLIKILASLIWATHRLGVAATPSTQAERRTLAELLAEEDPDLPIVDLGSGWGGLLRHLARTYPDRQFRGIEAAWWPWLFTTLRSATERLWVSKVIRGIRTVPSFARGNFLNQPLQGGKIYITYLSGPAMKALRRRFEKDQPMGGILISIAFAMPGWSPERTRRSGGFLNTDIYLYRY
jgi:hypothetical protein